MSRQLDRVALGLTFTLAGLNHFRRPRLYQSTMPDYLPAHRALVAIRLIAVFPANLHMAAHARRYDRIPRWRLRLLFQGVLIAWVWWSTRLQPSAESVQA